MTIMEFPSFDGHHEENDTPNPISPKEILNKLGTEAKIGTIAAIGGLVVGYCGVVNELLMKVNMDHHFSSPAIDHDLEHVGFFISVLGIGFILNSMRKRLFKKSDDQTYEPGN
jgi:hypothetical protein